MGVRILRLQTYGGATRSDRAVQFPFTNRAALRFKQYRAATDPALKP